LNIIDVAVDLPSEEASVSYPGWVSYCALTGASHKLLPTLNRQPFNRAWVWASEYKQSLSGYPL